MKQPRPRSRKAKTASLAGAFVGLCWRTSRSFAFNMLMFALGFACGVAYIEAKVHYYARTAATERLDEIDRKMDEFAEMDKEYSRRQEEVKDAVRALKAKLLHDAHPECRTLLGRILLDGRTRGKER